LLAAFLSTFFICQLTSLYIGDEFIDYKFFVHFNPNSLSMAGAYIWQMIFAVLLLIAVPCALFAAACTLRKFLSVSPKTGKCPISSAATKSLMAAILIATIFVLWLPEKSMYHKFREIFLFSGFSFNKKIDFDKVINDLEQKGNGIKFTPK
jgi:hypothetical protein